MGHKSDASDQSALLNVKKNFAATLKTIRKEKSLSQSDLVYKSGMSIRMISDLERGILQPSLVTLFKLSKGLDIGIQELIEKLLIEMNNK